MYKGVIVILLFIGILCVVISLVENTKKCPKEKIIYRYIPRTFEEDQNEPVYVTDIFYSMFNHPSPWVRSINNVDYKKLSELNKFFIKQN
jgi:hypothetical protein